MTILTRVGDQRCHSKDLAAHLLWSPSRLSHHDDQMQRRELTNTPRRLDVVLTSDFNRQSDGQPASQWHIYGTQEWKKLFTSVSQRQRTAHDSADRQHSERVSAGLLIRRSSVRNRRGPRSTTCETSLLPSGSCRPFTPRWNG